MLELAGRKSANWIASYPQVLQAFTLPCLVSMFVNWPYWRPGVSSPHTTSSFLSEHLSFENPDHSLAIPAASKLYGTINKLQHTETSLGFSSTFNTSNNVVWLLAPFSIPRYWQLSLVMTMRHRRPHSSGQCFHYELGNAGQELIASAMPPSQTQDHKSLPLS